MVISALIFSSRSRLGQVKRSQHELAETDPHSAEFKYLAVVNWLDVESKEDCF